MNTKPNIPVWAQDLITLYESDAANQFILSGNVNDRILMPDTKKDTGTLVEFMTDVLLASFDVVITYDLGSGIRIDKGGQIFSQWPRMKNDPHLPKTPRPAIELLNHYFRYCANLAMLGHKKLRVAGIIKAAQFVTPDMRMGVNHDLNAMALLMRDWSVDTSLTRHHLATFFITENLNDIHTLLANNTRASNIRVPLPGGSEIQAALERWASKFPVALKQYADDLETPANGLTGTTLGSIESLLKTKEYKKQEITPNDLSDLKKELVEKDCNGLIEFIESDLSLDIYAGADTIKSWIRQDIKLWQKSDLDAMPMGYLLCGPVGTGKTFLVKCLAGEAGVPVVKLKNFRDKWVGSTEGNLERIFRLLHALGRCIVFIDEADQTLGKRDSGSTDSGLSGRVYSMIAQEMSNPANRGRILWILASSRPDLMVVDLTRPGRIDVKMPIFPTTTGEESFNLIKILTKRRGLTFAEETAKQLEGEMPIMLTPGAAEALAMKIYRTVKTADISPDAALAEILRDYQSPVPEEVMNFQIQIAMDEASDLDFVPEYYAKRFGK
ncbi:MAG: AAA+ superfamily predicted ATPase [Verrucomicrobiales bacterium]